MTAWSNLWRAGSFDDITGGGLPKGRTTLLDGGPGSGKTIFALQHLIHGAQHCGEPGIFVAFEEAPTRIISNFQGFGWPIAELQAKKKLFIIDAQPSPELIQSGGFDLLDKPFRLEDVKLMLTMAQARPTSSLWY